MKRKKNRNKISINSWMEMKPYDNASPIDFKYLRLCNTVFDAIKDSNAFELLQEYLLEDEIKSLACFLTSYFEDKISETNIFNTFVEANLELYGKPLPFCVVTKTTTSENEVAIGGLEDTPNYLEINFLVWYFVNTTNQDGFYFPTNEVFSIIAEIVIQVFEEALTFQYKANPQLIEAYKLDEDEENYYNVRNLMSRIIFQTYLFFPDTGIRHKENVLKLFEEIGDTIHQQEYLNELTDHDTYSLRTKLLSLNAKEWLSKILGKNHKLTDEILNISQKVTGYFTYEKQDKENIFVKHIASGKKFKVTKKSFSYGDQLTKDSIFYMGIVKWKQEWWFSGIFYMFDYDQKIVDEEKMNKDSIDSVAFLNNDEKIKESLAKQLKVFKEISNGEQINFIPIKELKNFIENFYKQFNKTVNLEKEKNNEKVSHENNFVEFNFDSPELADKALVFFNPNSGIEFALCGFNAFPLKNNPYCNIKESETDIIGLLTGKNASKELVLYCVNNCKEKLPMLNTDEGRFVLANLDFLLRFWKVENYYTKPAISFI